MDISSNSHLVSVIIPAYNHERYVQETVRSIMEQTYRNIELIIIDDGSTDGTFNKITELEAECRKRFTNVVMKTQANVGICETLNRLISLTSGEFLYLIASDDVAEPNAIECLIQCFESDDVVLAVGDNSIIDSDSRITGWGKQREYDTGEIIYYSWWEYNCHIRPELKTIGDNFGSYESLLKGPYLTNGYLMRKSSVIRTGGYPAYGMLEDWYMWLQLAKIGRFVFVDRKLLRYRWHEANTVRNWDLFIAMMDRTVRQEEQNVINSGDRGLVERFYRNRDFSADFFREVDAMANERKYGRRSELHACYRKLRNPTRKQRLFYILSFMPLTYRFLHVYRCLKLLIRKRSLH